MCQKTGCHTHKHNFAFCQITSVNENGENISVLYTTAHFFCAAVILAGAFSSAFQISAYPISSTFHCIFLYFEYLPLSDMAGLGDIDQSSAFR